MCYVYKTDIYNTYIYIQNYFIQLKHLFHVFIWDPFYFGQTAWYNLNIIICAHSGALGCTLACFSSSDHCEKSC